MKTVRFTVDGENADVRLGVEVQGFCDRPFHSTGWTRVASIEMTVEEAKTLLNDLREHLEEVGEILT